MMWIGSLALIGVPPFSGFFSKESIIHLLSYSSSFVGVFAYIVSLLVAFLTAFYSFRLIFLVFHGISNSDDKVAAHIHESPILILLPLFIMSFLAIIVGFVTNDLFLNSNLGFWNGSHVVLSKDISYSLLDPVLIFPILGIGLAWLIYIRGVPVNIFFKKHLHIIYKFLLRKWLIDEFYTTIIINPILFISNTLWKIGDEKIIEGIGPHFLTRTTSYLGSKIRKLQTGYISDYIMIIFSFLVIVIPLIFFWRYK